MLNFFRNSHEKDQAIAMMVSIFPNLRIREQSSQHLVCYSAEFDLKWIVSALQVSNGLIEILHNRESNLFERFSMDSILSCVKTLLNCGNYDEYIDLVKYSTTYLHARSLRQKVLPKACSRNGEVERNLPLLFSGPLRKYLYNRMSTLSKKNQHLFWSIAQLKRCAEVVPEDFIEKSLHKHRKAMDLRSDDPPADFVSSLSEKVDDVLRGLTFEHTRKFHEYSSSACWENTSVNGGAKGFLLSEHVFAGHTSNDELLSMTYHPRSGVTERRGFCVNRTDLLDLSHERGNCTAMVYPICEPLKIRNITKSNAVKYAIAKGLQLDVHGYMRKLDQFRLIGEPCTQRHIEWLVGRSKGGFASGDFSAATDNVKIQLTKMCFERIINRVACTSGISGDEISTFREVLYEHEIHYPTGYGEKALEPVLQKNGQLMGSVLSFFILCLINLCTYWHAVCPEVKRFQDLTVLVNGDDILFRCTPDEYQQWLDTLPYSGLTPSPGKNFYADAYCTVNSILFHVNEQRNGEVTTIPFYNVGMLLGQSKVARVSDVEDKPIQYLFPEILEGSLNPLDSLKRFLYYNAEKLKQCAISDDGHSLNYFIPRELGGLGIQCPGMTYITFDKFNKLPSDEKTASFYAVVNRRQLRFAQYAHEYWISPYVKPLFRPAGEQIDLDKESNFQDHPDMRYKIRIDQYCPQIPEARELQPVVHPPNWCSPTMSKSESENLTYKAHRLFFDRRYMKNYKKKSDSFLSEIADRRYVEYQYLGYAPINMVA